MWFTLPRSNRYSPFPARLAPSVRAACCDIVDLLHWIGLTSKVRDAVRQMPAPKRCRRLLQAMPAPSQRGSPLAPPAENVEPCVALCKSQAGARLNRSYIVVG